MYGNLNRLITAYGGSCKATFIDIGNYNRDWGGFRESIYATQQQNEVLRDKLKAVIEQYIQDVADNNNGNF